MKSVGLLEGRLFGSCVLAAPTNFADGVAKSSDDLLKEPLEPSRRLDVSWRMAYLLNLNVGFCDKAEPNLVSIL